MKNHLKEKALDERDSMPKGDITDKSNKIAMNLTGLEQYKKSKTLMFYFSFNSEVDTHNLIMGALKQKTVVIPKVISDRIEPSIIINLDNLVRGRFGIPEPIEVLKIAYKHIDLVIVPGIVFDEGGHRIGYGLGYYDKFLAKVPKAIKIGLAFDFQVIDKIPKEVHDVPVDFIVTEKRLIECKR